MRACSFSTRSFEREALPDVEGPTATTWRDGHCKGHVYVDEIGPDVKVAAGGGC